MGNYNCCGFHQEPYSSSTIWAAGDEWGPSPMEKLTEKEDLLDGKARAGDLSYAEGSTVKIRISKKQLEELLKKINEKSGAQKKIEHDDHGLLQRLIDQSYAYHLEIHDQRSWKPVLKTIPEIN